MINRALVCALVVVVLLHWLGPTEIRVRNFEFFPDMARSFRYNSFVPNANFTDGATLRRPVTGTMPVEQSAWASRNRESEMVPQAGRVIDNPFPSGDAAAVARGHAVYDTFCTPCHGADGSGNGPVTQHGYPAPPSVTTGSAVDMDDTALFRIVSQGGIDMPAYASQIPPADRWRAVLYLRSLQGRISGPAGQR